VQTAYQIVVDGLWDSTKVLSDRSIQIHYAGSELKSRQRCVWKVRTWDGDDKPSPWSEPALWEMAFLQRNDWKAKWIVSPIMGGADTRPPAARLTKTFRMEKAVASARLYITALGLHMFDVNGDHVSDDVFVPGRTDYRKRVPYHAYDVTSLLAPGLNSCGAI